MEDWKKCVAQAKEDAERIYPLLANSSETARLRQNRIDLLEEHLRYRPRNMKALAQLIILKQERAADAQKIA